MFDVCWWRRWWAAMKIDKNNEQYVVIWCNQTRNTFTPGTLIRYPFYLPKIMYASRCRVFNWILVHWIIRPINYSGLFSEYAREEKKKSNRFADSLIRVRCSDKSEFFRLRKHKIFESFVLVSSMYVIGSRHLLDFNFNLNWIEHVRCQRSPHRYSQTKTDKKTLHLSIRGIGSDVEEH